MLATALLNFAHKNAMLTPYQMVRAKRVPASYLCSGTYSVIADVLNHSSNYENNNSATKPSLTKGSFTSFSSKQSFPLEESKLKDRAHQLSEKESKELQEEYVEIRKKYPIL